MKLVAGIAVGIALALAFLVFGMPQPKVRISNSKIVPASMEEEGDRRGPFWPSPARTSRQGTIDSEYFLDSKLCGTCHKDIYEQWNSSVHHVASFNNQFYRKSIEDMQRLQGSTQGSKWCAGCHDHAVIFSGRWEKPIKDQIQTPEAQAGLACVSCHSITHVNGSVGNGDFEIEYPRLHFLLASRNPILRGIYDKLIYTFPAHHKQTFMKPFMREQSSEFCSTCHKVHLDVPVNSYRWLRGFNDYDNWQASGFGHGARSFYYPPKGQTCSDCHMPLVASQDPGNKNGKVHSHRFPGANTAIPHVNGDKTQLAETEKFLKSGFITVDLFAISPVESNGAVEMKRRAEAAPALNTAMAVGEEAESHAPVYLRDVGKIAAPLDTAQVKLEPGTTVRLDAVVRTRKIGHFFPGGTVDAFDIWLELIGRDASGEPFFWSGQVEDGGKGPVEPGAHFYRSYLLDGDGNHINKRNAWQARSLLYARLIPPGAADTVHYRVTVPRNVKGPVTFTAKLNYRKFSHFYTQHSYSEVGGTPDLPIVTLAEKSVSLGIGKTNWTPNVLKADRERWNDWGIGMLLQGDIKGAEYAFRKVTEAEPGYTDGWLNVARALIQEGETEAARPFVAKAKELGPKFGRVYFFEAMIHKAAGDYDAALQSLRTTVSIHPNDRVVHNQIGRLLFLKRDYRGAIAAFERALEIDTEDVQAHYNLMLAYRGAGDDEKAAREEKLFRRFKADESAQSITQRPRALSPEDNNERQSIHDHESVLLPRWRNGAGGPALTKRDLRRLDFSGGN
ncbi:MAG: tetratricopeptide repeat protein [Bryobacteraceae bacterium]|nr:tetratricopeptide repeat protein [Bryobacteraceae bacterium]